MVFLHEKLDVSLLGPRLDVVTVQLQRLWRLIEDESNEEVAVDGPTMWVTSAGSER